jgi:UDP:flavonoid glycosyltransferase YjiC (YdhE family)
VSALPETPSVDRYLESETELFSDYARRTVSLFAERNQVYRSQFRREGLPAVLGWIRTKLQRVATCLHGDIVDDESLAENLLDMGAYCLMAAMLAENPTVPEDCAHLLRLTGEGQSVCVLCGVELALGPIAKPLTPAPPR